MENILEKINSYGYDIKKSPLLYRTNSGSNHYSTLTVVNPEGVEKELSCDIYIKTNQSVKKPESREEAEQLIKEGKYIKILADEVYREFYSMNDDEFYIYKNGYSEKTAKYFEQLKKEIGYISQEISADSDGAEFTVFEEITNYDLFFNTGKVSVGKLEEDKYIAQYSYAISIDDFAVEKMYFKNLPKENDIKIAIALEDFTTELKLGHINEFLECSKCLKTTHWTDIPGEFHTKVEVLEKKYCGC